MGHKYKDKYISVRDIYKNIKSNIYKNINYGLYYSIVKRFFEILIRDIYGFDPEEFNIENDVKIYRVVYESLGANGEPTQLSGAIYVPQVKKQKSLPTRNPL